MIRHLQLTWKQSIKSSTRCISIKATNERLSLQHEQYKADTTLHIKTTKKMNRASRLFQKLPQRPSSLPLHVSSICGILMRAIAENNPELSWKSYQELVDGGYGHALTPIEQQKLQEIS